MAGSREEQYSKKARLRSWDPCEPLVGFTLHSDLCLAPGCRDLVAVQLKTLAWQSYYTNNKAFISICHTCTPLLNRVQHISAVCISAHIGVFTPSARP